VTGAIELTAPSSVLIKSFAVPGRWCNWHIENLTSETTAHKINFWL
jgi:hypothetical protein